MRRRARELVPGTDELAVVATVDAIAHHAPQLDGNRAVELDRQIRDAAARIELIGRGYSAGGARGNARAARAAMRADGFVERQRQVGQDLADEKIRSRVARDEVRVLSNPAEARLAC